IICANVLHATRDLRQSLGHVRRLLAPNGMLLLIEGTSPTKWIDVTFGFAQGWWRFADQRVKAGHPLIGQEAWRSLLAESGFPEVEAISTQDNAANDEPFAQTLFLAQAAASAAELAPGLSPDRHVESHRRPSIGAILSSVPPFQTMA